MQTQSSGLVGKRVQFGVFELDLDLGELRKRGVRIRLPNQAISILEILTQSAGAIVSRDELRERLWEPSTFVDFDNNLNGLIKKLREALGDSATSPRFIETIPKRGYRFIADVKATGASARQKSTFRPTVVASWLLTFVAASSLLLLWKSWMPEISSADRTLVAVLPFRDHSPVSAPSHLSESISEEVINHLVRLDPARLGVIARASSFSFQGRDDSIAEIGETLAADLVLDGSFQVYEGKIRVSAQLIQVSDQTNLWAENYSGEATRMLDVPTWVASLIASSLRIELEGSGADPGQGYTADSEALDAYWKGRFFRNQFTREGVDRSVGFFEQAVSIDPGFAVAWAGLADACNYRALLGFAPADVSYARAREAAETAIRLAPSLAAGHAALGFNRLHYDWEFAAAGEQLEHAAALEPGRAVVHHWLAGYYSILGRHERALSAAEEARKLDPLSLRVNTDLVWYYYYAGRFEEALRHSRRVLELNPAAPGLWVCVDLSLRQLGRKDEAVATLRGFLEGQGAPAQMLTALDQKHASGGAESVWRWFAEAQESRSPPGSAPAYLLAVNFAAIGEADRTIHWLTEAVDQRNSFAPYLSVDPAFVPLRDDDRFKALVARIGVK